MQCLTDVVVSRVELPCATLDDPKDRFKSSAGVPRDYMMCDVSDTCRICTFLCSFHISALLPSICPCSFHNLHIKHKRKYSRSFGLWNNFHKDCLQSSFGVGILGEPLEPL